MLVLTRQLDESIMVGDDVLITVVEIRSDRVRLGIAAPDHITVHRQEVFEMLQRETLLAAFMAAAQNKGQPETKATVTNLKSLARPKRDKGEPSNKILNDRLTAGRSLGLITGVYWSFVSAPLILSFIPPNMLNLKVYSLL